MFTIDNLITAIMTAATFLLITSTIHILFFTSEMEKSKIWLEALKGFEKGVPLME
jgi:hypothetical protein